MLLVAESTAKSAITREESRGGHTREDFPGMNNKWRQINLISSFDGNQVNVREQVLPTLPKELFAGFTPVTVCTRNLSILFQNVGDS